MELYIFEIAGLFCMQIDFDKQIGPKKIVRAALSLKKLPIPNSEGQHSQCEIPTDNRETMVFQCFISYI